MVLLSAAIVVGLQAVVVAAVDAAPYIAASATALSALIALWAFVSANRARRTTRDVDAIRVAQSALVETIDTLRDERDADRRELVRLRTENIELRTKLNVVLDQLEECRGWVRQLQRRSSST